jgi:hypothetical protein
MKTVYEKGIHISYSQAYVHLTDTDDDDDLTFDPCGEHTDGQVNGLLGAKDPAGLFLTFGLNTGGVFLRVNISDSKPPLDQLWEEVVEASFNMPEARELVLVEWGGGDCTFIPLQPGSYRVRYCAKNFRVAEDTGKFVSDDGKFIEQYELTFWPESMRDDEIIKVTSPSADYWHKEAQGTA